MSYYEGQNWHLGVGSGHPGNYRRVRQGNEKMSAVTCYIPGISQIVSHLIFKAT